MNIFVSILKSYDKLKNQIKAIDKTVKKIALNSTLPVFYAYELIQRNIKRKCLFIDLILLIDTTMKQLSFEKSYILQNLNEDTLVVCGVLNISERTYFRHKHKAIASFKKALGVDEEQLVMLLKDEEWLYINNGKQKKERRYKMKEKEILKSMPLKFDIVKNQKFELGRVIDITKLNFDEKDFMYKGKGNYAFKTKKHYYTLKEFYDFYKEAIKQEKGDISDSYDLLSELFSSIKFSFPKGSFWGFNYDLCLGTKCNLEIQIITFKKNGKELVKGTIKLDDLKIVDYDLTDKQRGVLDKVKNAILEIRKMYKEAQNERS